MSKLGGKTFSEDTDKQAGGQVNTVVGGTNVTVDSSVPADPVVNATDQVPLTTKGDLLTFDTVDKRLAVGADTFVLTADSAEGLGMKWATPAAGSTTIVATNERFSPPLITDLPTWVNQQNATVTDDPFEGFLLADLTTDTNTDNHIMRVKTMPSGSWTATAKIKTLRIGASFNTTGMVLRDSATGRITILRLYNVADVNKLGVANYIVNTFDSGVGTDVDLDVDELWLRIEDDTVNFKFSYSNDGVNFREHTTQARTAFLASPDQLGLFLNPENDAPVFISCSYWDDKDTPAITAAVFTAGNDIITFKAGAPGNTEKIHTQVATGSFKLPVGLTASQAYAEVTATASATIDIKKNGSNIGTINFAIAANVGTFTFATETSFVAGDRVQLVNQASADATLADISINLRRTN